MTDEIRINPIPPIPDQFPRKHPETEEAIKHQPKTNPEEKTSADSVELSEEALREIERLRNEFV